MAPRAFGPDELAHDRAARGNCGLPEAYVLADGVNPEEIELLLAAWTWVNSTMGDAYDLVILGARRTHAPELRRRTQSLGLGDSVRLVEGVRADDMPAIYRGAEAFLFAGARCSGEAVQRALASGAAIVGVETPEATDLIGPAGYLVPGRDARLLGAACISVLAEPEMRERLRSRAREQGASLRADAPLEALLRHLEDVVR